VVKEGASCRKKKAGMQLHVLCTLLLVLYLFITSYMCFINRCAAWSKAVGAKVSQHQWQTSTNGNTNGNQHQRSLCHWC